jgi:hypothetical protein
LFRSARRRDWLWVLGFHGLALVLTGLVLVGLCAPQSRDVPFLLYPHLFYWTIGSTLVSSRVIALFWLFGWVLGPLCFYRAVSYYQRGATRSLLAAGLRGRWAQTTTRATRFRFAVRYAVSPTWLLARRQVTEDFELVEPSLKPSRIGLVPVSLAVLAISLNHWPVFTGVELALCVVPKWTIALPSWAGPCTFGPARGQQSPSSPCRELTPIP